MSKPDESHIPPRILHITPVYPPYAGGIGIAAKMMVEGLRSRGWRVDACFPLPRNAPVSVPSNIQTLKPLLRIGNAALVPQLRSIKGYDIIHLHVPFFGGAEWLLMNQAIRTKKTKLIVQYHHDADAGGLKGSFFKWYDKLFLPRILKRADKVVVSTMDYARYSRMAPYIDDRFIEIPFGVDVERFYPLIRHSERSVNGAEESLADASQHSFEISRQSRKDGDNKSFTILFVGSLDHAHWFKGLDVLLKSLALLKRSAGEHAASWPAKWQCLIIGDGDLRHTYEQMALDLDLSGEVKFLGKVSHDDLPKFYQDAEIFVFPSVSRAEAFGLVVLEAMTSGLPVIASDLPGVRTLITHPVRSAATPPEEGTSVDSPLERGGRRPGCVSCGFTFPMGDHHALVQRITQLMEDEHMRKQMGENARKRVLEQYTVEKMLDKIENIY